MEHKKCKMATVHCLFITNIFAVEKGIIAVSDFVTLLTGMEQRASHELGTRRCISGHKW